MFSQVMQNSVYTFSAILVVFLAVLSIGGLLANGLARTRASTVTTLATLLALAGLAAAASPFLFMDATNGMRYIGSGMPWPAYLTAVFVNITLVLLIPGVLAGSVFPYLAKIAEGRGAPGRSWACWRPGTRSARSPDLFPQASSSCRRSDCGPGCGFSD